MAIQGTVPVGGSFAPTDSADSFGTHNDKWGVGGYRIVKTIANRDNIPVNESELLNLDDDLASGRRKLGMMVYVSDENKFYVLTIAQATWDGYNEGQKVTALANNANWVEFSGGGNTGNIGFSNNWIKNTVGEEIFISPQDGNTWLWLPSDTQAAAGDYANLASTDPNSAGVYITTNAGSWHFKNDGILEVPGRISFGGIDWQSIGIGNVNSHGGSYGISLYCTVGYELNWQAGYLAARDPYSPYDLRPIYSDSLIKYATPGDYPTFHATFDDDTLITKAYLNEQAYLTDAPSDGSTYGRKDGAWSTVSGGGIPHFTVTGPDTYTVTGVPGVSAYNDGDAYLVRFTNGNTTSCSLSINGLNAKTLYRNNDGPLIGGDILAGAEMLCVYNSTTDGFQCIGTSPNTLLAYVTNSDTVTIYKGQAVYISGAQGDRVTVQKAINTGDSTSAQTIGIVYSTSIGVNQKGIIITQGELDGLSLFPIASWDDGDPIYLDSTAGGLTKTKPHAPNHLVYLGYVITSSNGAAGRMYVKVQNGYELDELHNVDLFTTAPTSGDYLYFNGSLWVNSKSWQGNTIPISKGGTNLTSLGTASQLLRVNSGATALEYFTITKSDVGLSAVENTALSTWAGSANITTLGTITTGTWNATSIAGNKQTVMVAATGIAAGTQGAVPQPLAGDNVKYLKGDGTWDIPVATASLSSLSAATTNATLANANSTITWNWNSNTTANAFVLGSTGLTTGNLLTLGISGSAATSADNLVITNSSTVNTSGRGLDIAISGPTANAVTFGAVISNTKTATGTGVNTALQLTASGATTNYALDVTTGIVRLGQSTASVPHMLFTPGTAALTGSTNGMLSYATVSSNSSFYLWKDSAVTTIITKDRNPDFAVGSNYGVIISDASGNLSKSADLTALGIFSQTTTVTVNSLVTTSLLTGTIVGSNTLPANYFAAGKTLRLFLSGNIITSSSAGLVSFNVTLGGTQLISTGNFTINTSISGAFTLEAIITCRTAGSSSDFKTSILVCSSSTTPTGIGPFQQIIPGVSGPFTQSVYTNSASVSGMPINTTNSLQLLVNTTMTTSASTIDVHNVYAEYIN